MGLGMVDAVELDEDAAAGALPPNRCLVRAFQSYPQEAMASHASPH